MTMSRGEGLNDASESTREVKGCHEEFCPQWSSDVLKGDAAFICAREQENRFGGRH